MAQTIRVRLHRMKAYTKAKKIIEQAIEIKEKNSNIKKKFRFRSVWMGLYNDGRSSLPVMWFKLILH